MIRGGVQDSYAGYVRDEDNVIAVVGEGDPAQRAGLQVGDRLLTIGGSPVEEVPSSLLTPEAPVGTRTAFTVERGGESVELDH